MSLATGLSLGAVPFGYVFRYGTGGDLALGCAGAAGTRVDVRLVNNGNVRASGQATLDNTGRGSVTVNALGGVQRGDQVELLLDGQPFAVIPVTARDRARAAASPPAAANQGLMRAPRPE